MSMLYDPVTREFRPRETKSPTDQPTGGAAAPMGHEAVARRSRRWLSVRRRHRQRELLFWIFLFIISGSLIWCTILLASKWGFHSAPDKSSSVQIRSWE